MAWLRNKKTGGWFEIPDEDLNTNKYMNDKIREEKNEKFTRTKLKNFLDDFKEKIEKAVENDEEFKDYNDTEKKLIKGSIPDYDNVVLNMRTLGLNIKDIQELEYRNEKNSFNINAKFKDGREIYIVEISKF